AHPKLLILASGPIHGVARYARPAYRRLTGRAATPQLLIRVGEAPVMDEVSPMTPRRPVHDVLTFHRDKHVQVQSGES
ncbi:MAG TPA: hypothetical protein VN959_08210, partial [Mycobacterium sp.]|nr:hypothetical protein [Mycobacterium sp.]